MGDRSLLWIIVIDRVRWIIVIKIIIACDACLRDGSWGKKVQQCAVRGYLHSLFNDFYSVLQILFDLRGYVLIHLKVLNFFLMHGGHVSSAQ